MSGDAAVESKTSPATPHQQPEDGNSISCPDPQEVHVDEEFQAISCTAPQEAHTDEASQALPEGLSAAAEVQSTAQVFQLDRRKSSGISQEALVPPVPSSERKNDELHEWYRLDDSTANVRVAETSTGELPKSAGLDEATRRMPRWLDGIGSGARKIGGRTKQAILSEARLLVQDVRDLSGTVREGARYTAEDTTSLARTLRDGAKCTVEDTKSRVKKDGLLGALRLAPGESAATKETSEVQQQQQQQQQEQQPEAIAESTPAAVPSLPSDAVSGAVEAASTPALSQSNEGVKTLLQNAAGGVLGGLQRVGSFVVGDLNEGAPAGPLDSPTSQGAEVFWQLPSAYANYVALTSDGFALPKEEVGGWRRLAGGASKIASGAFNKIDEFAGKLDEDFSGSIVHIGDRLDEDSRSLVRGIARRHEEVSQGLARHANVVSQKLQASKGLAQTAKDVGQKLDSAAAPVRRRLTGALATGNAEDDIFEIGSDEWSEPGAVDEPLDEGLEDDIKVTEKHTSTTCTPIAGDDDAKDGSDDTCTSIPEQIQLQQPQAESDVDDMFGNMDKELEEALDST